jgi:hypothetical protein
MVANVKIMISTSPIGTLGLVATLYQGNQLREMYSMCRCCWNVVTYKTPCVTVKYFKSIAGKTVEREQPT